MTLANGWRRRPASWRIKPHASDVAESWKFDKQNLLFTIKLRKGVKWRKKEFDACMLGWSLDWKSDPFQLWHSSQADVPDSSNAISYANSEMDKLIDELRVTLEPDRQIELYHRMHRVLYDDQPYTFLFTEKFTAFRDARLQNMQFYKIRPGYDDREWYAKRPRAPVN